MFIVNPVKPDICNKSFLLFILMEELSFQMSFCWVSFEASGFYGSYIMISEIMEI